MLYIFAQSYAARLPHARLTEFRRHQQHCEILVHPCKPATVNLAHIDSASLKQLFEDDAVLAMLAGCDPHAGLATNPGVSQDVIRAGRLFHPPRVELGKLPRTV